MKKRVMSKYFQTGSKSGSPKLVPGSPGRRISSRFEKGSLYKSEITEFQSNISSMGDIQPDKENTKISSEEPLKMISEQQGVVTEDSGNYSPVLTRRLSPLRLGNEEGRSGPKIGLDDFYFSQILSKGAGVSPSNYQQMMTIGEHILRKGVTHLKNSKSAPISPPNEATSTRRHTRGQSLKIPMSLSSVQLLPVEELEA